MPENKRFIVNIRKGGRGGKIKRVDVAKEAYDRIHSNLIRNDTCRIMIHEAIDGGVRVHYVAPSEVDSLEELFSDGWED